MLRNIYVAGSEELKKILQDFKLGDAKLIDVTLYKMLTPDSFIWRLRMNDGIYYLYAEDYIYGLEAVKKVIQEVAGTHRGQFVEVKQSKDFDKLETVQAATTYKKPEDYDSQIRKFAADSGFDLVFFYKMTSGKEDE